VTWPRPFLGIVVNPRGTTRRFRWRDNLFDTPTSIQPAQVPDRDSHLGRLTKLKSAMVGPAHRLWRRVVVVLNAFDPAETGIVITICHDRCRVQELAGAIRFHRSG